MAELVEIFLPMILYICAIILLIILIVLSIKFIGILDKAERVIDNVEDKVNSLNTAFSIIDKTSDSIIGIGNTILNAVKTVTSRFVNKKQKYEEEDFDE